MNASGSAELTNTIEAGRRNVLKHDGVGRLSLKTDAETMFLITLKRAKGFWNIEFRIASVNDKRVALWPLGYLSKSRDRDRASKREMSTSVLANGQRQ
jgi:hypothetical protein